MIVTAISVTGLILLVAILNGNNFRLLGLYMSGAGTACYVLLQTSITSNFSGYTKKVFYTGGNLVFYTFGNLIGPLLLVTRDSLKYVMGMGIYIGANAFIIILSGYIRYSFVLANKRHHLDKNSNAVALPDDLEDITDVQNEHFVYRP